MSTQRSRRRWRKKRLRRSSPHVGEAKQVKRQKDKEAKEVQKQKDNSKKAREVARKKASREALKEARAGAVLVQIFKMAAARKGKQEKEELQAALAVFVRILKMAVARKGHKQAEGVAEIKNRYQLFRAQMSALWAPVEPAAAPAESSRVDTKASGEKKDAEKKDTEIKDAVKKDTPVDSKK